MGHNCLGTIIKKETKYSDGEIKYETKCITNALEQGDFGSLDCDQKEHIHTKKTISLLDGTKAI